MSELFDAAEAPTRLQEAVGEGLVSAARSADRIIGSGAGGGKSWLWARFVRWLYRNDTGVRDFIDSGAVRSSARPSAYMRFNDGLTLVVHRRGDKLLAGCIHDKAPTTLTEFTLDEFGEFTNALQALR